MFADAKILETPKTKAKKFLGLEIIHIDGIEELAILKEKVKEYEGKISVLEDKVKSQSKEIFISQGEKTHKRPDNFQGVDGRATASCQLRKRSTTSVLTDVEVATLKEANIPFETITDVEETFVINSIFAKDQKVLARVAKALKELNLDKDFILKQLGQTRNVVSEESLDVAFQRGIFRKVADILTTIAVKTNLPQMSALETFKTAKKLLGK